MLKRLVGFVRELLFPPKCASCGAFLKKNILEPAAGIFCEDCARAWRRSRLERCGVCGLEYGSCRCMPRFLRRLGVRDCVKLIPYERVRETVGKRCILAMKKRNLDTLFRFFGKELATAFEERLRESGREAERVLVTYLPRSPQGVNRYGFDQSHLLAKRVAQCLGAELSSVFKRRAVLFAQEQKHLDAAERRKNMQSAFALSKKGRRAVETCDTLLLVDDVITTGASLGGCVALLEKDQRAKVICLTVGTTPNVKKQQNRVAFWK